MKPIKLFSSYKFIRAGYYVGLCSVIVTAFVIVSCTAQPKASRNGLQIVDATTQEVRGGVKGNAPGTRYRIRIIAPANNSQFQVVGIWKDSLYMNAQAFCQNDLNRPEQFSKGDTLFIQANISWVDGKPHQGGNPINKIKRPMIHNGEGLIHYQLKGQTRFETIERFTELEPELRP
jgi:hypothetical protein